MDNFNFTFYLTKWPPQNEEAWRTASIAPLFLTSSQYRDEWLASRFCYFTPGKTAAGASCIGGWVDPRAGLDAVE
jgi:hypothetical protein